ncbi:TPM domain-containing protein [Flavilitoribacter nigricans]|nr:TPM domain-containing protein [Flavilitoribacter nigricans]
MRLPLVLLLLIISQIAWSQSGLRVEEVPDPKEMAGRGYVSDPGSYLSPNAVNQLNNLIGSLEQNSTAQIAVVLLPSIGDQIPKDFATELFQHWGIGQAGTDNGLLILVVMDQRRVEFETGYGLEGVLPDVICYRIINENFVPHFKEGDYDAGLISSVNRVKTLLEDPVALEEIRTEMRPKRKYVFNTPVPPLLFYYAIITILFHVAISAWVALTMANKETLYDKYRHIRYIRAFIFIILFPVPYIAFWFILGSLLKRLRNQPRFSKLNGEPMRKLTEEEEDEYLKKGQIIEEQLGSVDYDVWITEDLEDVMILPYAKRMSKYSNCPKCKFKTYHHIHTNTLRHATEYTTGLKEQIHECENCNYFNRKTIVIPRITRSSGGSGSSGGGGSWGGGSSGGGGAGGSW